VDPELVIRRMTRNELNEFVDWAADEGWNPGTNDEYLIGTLADVIDGRVLLRHFWSCCARFSPDSGLQLTRPPAAPTGAAAIASGKVDCSVSARQRWRRRSATPGQPVRCRGKGFLILVGQDLPDHLGIFNAMILTAPPQAGQVAMSIPNTRFRRCT